MSLRDHHKLSDWPKSFLGATNSNWCAALEQGDTALILFWVTWTGISATPISAANSKEVVNPFTTYL